MHKALKRHRLDGGRRADLARFDPASHPCSVGDKLADKARVAELAGQLADYQDRFYARRSDKLLLVLQGMDTSGKDGTIRAVFQGVDPLGVRAVSYRAPAVSESDRDFLWRHHRDVPGRHVRNHSRAALRSAQILRRHKHVSDAERRR